MLGKHVAVSLMATALLATTAIAQSPSTSSPSATPSTSPPPSSSTMTPAASPATSSSSSMSSNSVSSTSFQGNWRTSKVIGLNVYNDKDESLGDINDLLTDKQGKIVAAVIGVGGFLGVGERYAAIPFEKLKFVDEPRKSSMASSSVNTGTRPAGTTTGAAPSTTTTTTTTNSGSSTMAPTTTTVAPTTTTMTPTTTTRATTTANDWAPDHALLNVSKDELKNMAEFKYTK